MNSSKPIHTFLCLFTITVFSIISPITVCAQSTPKLYVVFDSSLSMQSSQATIKALLEHINEQLDINPSLGESVGFIAFREEVSLETTSTLTDVTDILGKTILENNKENILPVLEALSNDVALSDALVLVFTDGRNADLVNTDLDSLLQKFKRRNIQFQVVKSYPNWCGRKEIFAINNKKQILGESGQFTDCENINYIKNKRYGDDSEPTGLAMLAFETGGLVWPISNFIMLAKDSQKVPENFLASVATKISTELLIKGEHRLSTVVQYSETALVGEQVFFEVLKNSSEDGVGEAISWQWDFDADGQVDDLGTFISKSFDKSGEYSIQLTLSNNDLPVVTRIFVLPITITE
jgi:hypothetical protein